MVAKSKRALNYLASKNMIFVTGVISFAKTSVMSDHLAAATTLVSIEIQIPLLMIYIL